jgi:LacI family transcriptional regulator
VLRRVKELNYQPNLHARGLASGQSFMIGLIVPDLVHAFFSEVAQNLAGTIRRKGFGLMIASSNEDAAFEREEIELMIRRRVDVLIVASCQPNASQLRKAAEEVPLILLDRRFDDFEGNFVGTDDPLVGRLATEHLLQMGYTRVAHIGGQKTSTSYGRLQGYRDTLTRHQLTIRESYIVGRKRADVGGDVSGRLAMEKLLLLKPLPDAVFCYNDPAAIGAMTAIISAGLSIPGDIAIVGAGNIRYAESLRVPLSSVEVSSAALGEHAGKLAVELTLKKRKARPRTILVRPKLMIRDSSTPLREKTSG